MKSCPTCNRTFPDDTLAFCLVDGSILSAAYDPETTQAFPSARTAETIPSFSSQPSVTFNDKQDQNAEKRSGKRGLVLGALMILLLTAGLVIGLSWNSLFGNNNSQAKESENRNPIVKTSPTVVPSTTPIATPQITPSPKSTTTIKKIDITGTWTGVFANRDAILFINSQEGDSFSGILKNSKKAIVSVSGHINSDIREISIQENRVIEEAIEGPDWVLGTNSGSISTDGKRMRGSGKDKAGHSYSWTFTK